MNWDDVKIFLAVARHGQILQAARRLGLNHATVGRRVSALESVLQAKLLERTTTGCTLTPAGEQFMAAAERMEAEMLNARNAIDGTDVEVAGTVRLGAPDGIGVAFLAPRLGPLLQRYPDLKVQLVPVSQTFSISRREADIAITIDRPEQGRLVARKLADYTLGLYASRAYIENYGYPETTEELLKHVLIGYVEDLIPTPALNYYDEIDQNWSARFECASALGQMQAVKAGAGIGVLHTFIAREDPDLIPILKQKVIRRAYWVTYHESTRSLRRITAVSDFINEVIDRERHIFT